MSSPSSAPTGSSRETVNALAAAAGLNLSPARLEALVIQAGPYLAQIRSLDDLKAGAEPASIFRLDDQELSK